MSQIISQRVKLWLMGFFSAFIVLCWAFPMQASEQAATHHQEKHDSHGEEHEKGHGDSHSGHEEKHVEHESGHVEEHTQSHGSHGEEHTGHEAKHGDGGHDVGHGDTHGEAHGGGGGHGEAHDSAGAGHGDAPGGSHHAPPPGVYYLNWFLIGLAFLISCSYCLRVYKHGKPKHEGLGMSFFLVFLAVAMYATNEMPAVAKHFDTVSHQFVAGYHEAPETGFIKFIYKMFLGVFLMIYGLIGMEHH